MEESKRRGTNKEAQSETRKLRCVSVPQYPYLLASSNQGQEQRGQKDEEGGGDEGRMKERVHGNPGCIINLHYIMYIYVTSYNVVVASFSYLSKGRRSRFSTHGNLALYGFYIADRLSQKRGTKTYPSKSANLMSFFTRFFHANVH